MADEDLELLGEFEAAGDETTAANIRRVGSDSQKAVDERILPVVGEVVAGLPAVEAGAAAAVDAEVASRDLIDGSDPRAMRRGKLSAFRIPDLFRKVAFGVDRIGETFIAKLAEDSDPNLRQVLARGRRRFRIPDAFRRIAFEVRPVGETFVARFSDDSDPRLFAGGTGAAAVTGVTALLVNGQSLPSGRAQPYGGRLDPTDPRILMAEWGAGDTASKAVTGLVTATVPLATRDVATGLSAATAMARRILREKPPGHIVVIVNAAVGSSGLVVDASNGVWRVDYTGTNPHLQPGAFNGFQAAIDLIVAKYGLTPELVFTWNQGEADGSTSRAAYEAALDALIAAFHARFGADVPVIIGGMNREYALAQGREHIQIALADTPRRVQRTAHVRMLPNSGYSANLTDFVHAAREAVEVQGWEMADAIPRAIANVAASVPDMPSRVSGLVVGNQLTVEWSPPFSRATGYTIQRSSDAGVTWTGIPHTTGETFTAPVTVTTGPVLIRMSVTNETGISAYTTPVAAIGAWHA